ncbi:hypothetical protein [Nostoc linckia]|nr:hypothetical protein [Nostoc linckia]
MQRRQILWGWMIAFMLSYSGFGTILYLSSAPLSAWALVLSGAFAWAVVEAESWGLVGAEGVGYIDSCSIFYGTVFGVMAWAGVETVASAGALALAISVVVIGSLVWPIAFAWAVVGYGAMVIVAVVGGIAWSVGLFLAYTWALSGSLAVALSGSLAVTVALSITLVLSGIRALSLFGSVAWASLVALGWAGAWALFGSLALALPGNLSANIVGSVVKAVVVAGFLAMAGAWALFGTSKAVTIVLSMVVVLFVASATSGFGAIVLLVAWFLLKVADESLISFNRWERFFILAGTSLMGLGIGWLIGLGCLLMNIAK